MASRRDDEWEALAAQVAAQLKAERASQDEDVDDDDTELYAEVLLEEASTPVASPGALEHLSRALEPVELPELELLEPTGTLPEPGRELTESLPELELDSLPSEELELSEPEGEVAWRGLHPASVVVNLIPRTWKTLVGLWPLLLVMLVGGGSDGFNASDLGWVGLFMLSGMGSTLVHFFTLRYRVSGGKLEIKQGLLNRQARIIDPARIQNVGEVRNVFHNLTGLVEVRLETAGGARTEGLLSALSVQEAERLILELERARGHAVKTEDSPESPALLELGVGELLAFGLSKASAGLVAVVLAVGLEVMPILSPQETASTLESLSAAAMAGALLITLVVSWLGSAALAVVRHFRYTLRLEPDADPKRVALSSQEGLLTTRRMRVPLGKVQMVMVDEPVLRRAMGFGTLNVETAGLGSVQEGIKAAELVVPMVDWGELHVLTQQALPQLQVDPWQAELNPAHPRALWRMLVGGTYQGVFFAGIAAWLVPEGFWWLGLLALPVVLVSKVLDWRAQGWLITPQAVISRRGFWRRRTWVLSREKLQSVHLSQGPLMRVHGLGRLAVRVAGSSVVLPDISWEQAEGLLDELRPSPGL